jgi:hypothetical protein
VVAAAVMAVAVARVCQEPTWHLLAQVQALPSMVVAAEQQQEAAATMAGLVTKTAAVAAAGAGRQCAQAGVAAAAAQRMAGTHQSIKGQSGWLWVCSCSMYSAAAAAAVYGGWVICCVAWLPRAL